MPNYRIVYGRRRSGCPRDLHDVNLEREDGWVVLFRGSDAILRVHEEHVQSVELIEES